MLSGLAARELTRQIAEQAVALGHHVVVVDRLEVPLVGRDEDVVA